MKQQRWSLLGMGVCALVSLACGGDEIDPLDPSTFAGMHRGELENDCKQTVECKIRMEMEVGEDPINSCVQISAERLESMPEKRMPFLIDVGRCSQFLACEYWYCTQNDSGTSWSMTQMARVQYDCMQEVACAQSTGTPLTGNPGDVVQGCIVNNLSVLSTFTPDQRAVFEQKYVECQTRQGCDFTTCFVF